MACARGSVRSRMTPSCFVAGRFAFVSRLIEEFKGLPRPQWRSEFGLALGLLKRKA